MSQNKYTRYVLLFNFNYIIEYYFFNLHMFLLSCALHGHNSSNHIKLESCLFTLHLGQNYWDEFRKCYPNWTFSFVLFYEFSMLGFSGGESDFSFPCWTNEKIINQMIWLLTCSTCKVSNKSWLTRIDLWI